MEPHTLIDRLKSAKIKHDLIADALGRSRTVAVQIMAGRRPLKAHEIKPLLALLKEHDGAEQDGLYAPVEVLPTFAGLTSDGVAEDDRETQLVPRTLIENTLRGRPRDFLLVHTRGDSMEPDFYQGDQLIIDKRDRSPIQPGPFAIRVGDNFVVKNVELTRHGVRVFSSNAKYSSEMTGEQDGFEIIGRPVWLGRLL